MPLIKSKTKEAFVGNLKAELSAGKPRAQALAIAYDVKRRARADGGSVHVGPISSTVPGRTDKHDMDVLSGSYVFPSETVSNLGENNTNAGMVKLHEVFGGTPEQIRKFFGAQKPPRFASGGAANDHHETASVPVRTAGGEYVVAPNFVKIIGYGDIKRGHETLDAWVMKRRKNHIQTLKALGPPAKD